jgi:DNA invertase Pin-like site-specific DNA recombinase
LKRGIKEMLKSEDPKKRIKPMLPVPTMNLNVMLPLDYPCQLYPRVSTPEQKENVSAEMQKDKSFACSCGWKEEDIILDERDLGVSGQTRMEDREAFNDMLHRIANNIIKAVVVANVDRLFRNKWGDESGKFMEICYTYGVIVITPDFIYDFRIGWHIDRFKRRCEEAWNYLEYHVYGRLLPARDARALAGYWIGGNMPIGFILDITEKINRRPNPNFYRYIPYEPHKKIVNWIFRRFKELHDNLTSLMVEIEAMPYLFPPFDESVSSFIISAAFSHYKKVEIATVVDGVEKIEIAYTIVTIGALRRLLTNRAYIGYWLHLGELVRTENHEAIVNLTLFTYSYDRLSLVRLDGTTNPRLAEHHKRYIKRYNAERPAILSECVRSDNPKVSIYTKDRKVKKGVVSYYGFYPEGVGLTRDSPASVIVASDLDTIVLLRLRERLQMPEIAQDYQDFSEKDEKNIEDAKEKLEDIEREIEDKKSLMTRVKNQIKSGKLTDSELLEAANESYNTAKTDLRLLEERKRVVRQIAEGHATSETLVSIDRDIAAIEALMTRVKNQIKSGKLADPELLEAANGSYNAAREELKRLEERKQASQQIAQEDNERRTFRELIRDVDHSWDEIVLPEEYPRLVRLFIKSVTLTMVAPSFFRAVIEWADSSWGSDSGLFYKGTYSNHQWTDEEIAILNEFYPTSSLSQLAELLPRRSRLAVYDYYKTRGVENPRSARKEEAIQARIQARKENKAGLPARNGRVMPYNVCLEDWKIMQEYQITKEAMNSWEGVKLLQWFLLLISLD